MVIEVVGYSVQCANFPQLTVARVAGVAGHLGVGEAILSAPISRLDALCQAANARIRPQLSDERKKCLAEQTRPFRFSKSCAKEKRPEAQKSANAS